MKQIKHTADYSKHEGKLHEDKVQELKGNLNNQQTLFSQGQ